MKNSHNSGQKRLDPPSLENPAIVIAVLRLTQAARSVYSVLSPLCRKSVANRIFEGILTITIEWNLAI